MGHQMSMSTNLRRNCPRSNIWPNWKGGQETHKPNLMGVKTQLVRLPIRLPNGSNSGDKHITIEGTNWRSSDCCLEVYIRLSHRGDHGTQLSWGNLKHPKGKKEFMESWLASSCLWKHHWQASQVLKEVGVCVPQCGYIRQRSVSLTV